MEFSPDAEEHAFKLLGQYSDHLKSESERIASLAGADRVSRSYVDHAASSLGIKRHVSQIPDLVTSTGLVLSGLAIGLTVAGLATDAATALIVVAVVVGVLGLVVTAVGVGLHLAGRPR